MSTSREQDKSVALKPGEAAPRHQQSKNQMYQWFGIARVVGREKMSIEKLEDRDLQPTEHTPHFHAYWLRYKNGTILAAPEQMRYASEDEILAAMELPDSLRSLDTKIPERDYLDIRSECPVIQDDVVHTTRINPVRDVDCSLW